MTLIVASTSITEATHSAAADLSVPSDVLSYTKRFSLASGTGANQADRIFHDQRTLAASATEDLNLAGSLVDKFGATITFARIKEIKVYALRTNTNNVNVTRPAANGVPIFLAAGDGMPVLPGGLLHWIAPNAAAIAVTAGTGDLLTFTNSAGSTEVTYDVIIIGASA
jgi:hypothetical protein